MPLPRLSGVLLHPTSLPGPHGSGDLGAGADHFINWLAVGRQSLWQVLPLGDVGTANSPYMSPSAFAGNVLLIDLAALRDAGWLENADLVMEHDVDRSHIDYPAVIDFRMARLRKAAGCFHALPQSAAHEEFTAFCLAEQAWLEDYALFRALEQAYGVDTPWQDWPAPLARRQAPALCAAAAAHADEIDFWKFCQWQFFRQWRRVKAVAHARGVEIVGDLPIFVALQSADVWAHPELFELDGRGFPTVVAGVPPDKFNANGQRWGNPQYCWRQHAAEGYQWWIARMRHMASMVDIVRIDHFRGFDACWEIPAAAKFATAGRWRPGPGAALFDAMRQQLGELRIIAEDLGVITPAVTALRKALALPGMRILQFAFDHDPDNMYLPHNYEADTVVYTGTHDNDTTRGWWAALPEYERDQVRRYLSVPGNWIHWDLIRAAQASVAAFAVIPMQDVLGLDSSHRMNRPGETSGAWGWRFHWEQVAAWHAEQLGEMAVLYGRCRKSGIAGRQPA